MTRSYVQGFEFNTREITGYSNSLTREHMLTRPLGKANHFIWILGHITMIRGTMIKLLGGRSGITPDEQKLFGPGSQLLAHDAYPGTELLLELFSDRGEELCRLLQHVEASKMQEESPFKFAFGEKTVSGAIHFLYWHEATHYGELNYLHKMFSRDKVQ